MSATVRYNPARQKWTVYVSRHGKRRSITCASQEQADAVAARLNDLHAAGGLIVGYLLGLGHMLQLDDDYVVPWQEVDERTMFDDDVNCAMHGVCDTEIPPSLSMMEQEMPRWWYCGWYCPEYRGAVEKAMATSAPPPERTHRAR